MPVRNGYRSNRGRSAIARRAINTNSTNGMMPQLTCYLTDARGKKIIDPTTGLQKTVTPCGYFGGSKKGGSAPNATGFMIPKSCSYVPYSSNENTGRQYLFKSLTGPGHWPRQVGAPLL